jgi:hypothetical protein
MDGTLREGGIICIMAGGTALAILLLLKGLYVDVLGYGVAILFPYEALFIGTGMYFPCTESFLRIWMTLSTVLMKSP